MRCTQAILHSAIALAIVLGPGNVGTALAQPDAAADDAAADARTLDAVSVTGSRIRVAGVEASSPVASVERAEFLTTQPVAVESFLKEFPALTPSIGLASNYEPGGAATINMRGLGDNRTLVLVDGRRVVPYNLANVVDTNTIPLALLQSVDMLTGGASVAVSSTCWKTAVIPFRSGMTRWGVISISVFHSGSDQNRTFPQELKTHDI